MYGDHRRIPNARATHPLRTSSPSPSPFPAPIARLRRLVPIQRISLASSLRACVLFCVLSVKLSCAQSLYQSTPCTLAPCTLAPFSNSYRYLWLYLAVHPFTHLSKRRSFAAAQLKFAAAQLSSARLSSIDRVLLDS